MHHFLRQLPLLALAGCASVPRLLVTNGLGCERAEHGVHARAIAIYTRVVTDRVCVLDAAGRCQPRGDGKAVGGVEVRLPRTSNTPPADALRQELSRRGVLARIARPRGPKIYASYGDDVGRNGLLVLELGEIGMSNDSDVAHVMVRESDATGELVRLVRTTSPVRGCWRLERRTSSAVAD
jgi:hypothetical protein